MAKLITQLYCDTCQTGIVKLIVHQLKSGEIKCSVTNCSRCKKGFGLFGLDSLKKVGEDVKV